ncbi:MAG: S41 family peptidase [Nitrospinae bacterium]|nr:S41 family peptidase [Nitrospinota bacterium]MZH04800.1 S41 family peptidase [Nitrospinota bacterium]MZH13212.1 S41 family peptidase [Nitrospinota bacterium]
MKLNSKNKWRAWLILPALIILFWALPVSSFNLNPLGSSAGADFFNKDLETFEEIFELVTDKYVYSPDPKKLFSAAIEKMVRTADSANATLTSNPSGSEIVFNNKTAQYFLNYDISHDMDELRKVYYFLHDESKNALIKNELEVAAIRGLIGSLDTYSQYLDKSAFEKSMRDTEGKYGGLGMVITMRDNRLFVVETMEDSPAQEAGILADDTFLKVNGKEIKKMQIQELADLLRGYPETQVTLTMFRPSEEKEYTRTLTRRIILVNTVKYEPLDNHIGYFKISSFSKLTEKQLKKHLEEAKQEGIKGFILDLRGNPGGLLHQSVKVASHFLFKGRMVVYTKGRSKEDYQEYRSLYKRSLYDMPVVVLINQYSASAAEIVAGALRDSGNALLIGENSYGKGSVQTIFRISNGTGVRLTTSKYYTPAGADITKHGIVPEINIINDIKDDSIEKEEKNNNSENKLNLKVSELKNFFENEGIKLDETRDATVEFARRILKNSHIASKKRSLEKAREIAANLDY